MKKHFQGKVYDTGKAEWQADSGYYYRGDMGVYFQESLYRKHNGTYFFHTVYYGVKRNGGRCSSILKEEITPASVGGAVSWGAEVLSDKDYDRVFREI